MKTERAAVLTAIRARDQFDKQLAGMEKGIDDANENVEKMLANQMRAAGYRREGAIWRRQSVIGSTLFGGEEWEDQHVGTYRRFTSPGFRARTDLSNKALKGLSGAEIFTLVERASEEMTRYQVLIFGRSDEQRSEKTKDGKTNAKYVKPADADEFHKVLKAILKDSREAWKTSAGASRHSDTEGLFNFHVGYRPVMKGEEVSEAGYGQMGRIMSQFMTNEARMGRGHAALMTPDYRKPMWDDDADNDGKSDGIIAAPSLATVIDIAANIVIAAVLPGGVGNVILGAALNLVDDFIFATADVATGYATSEQAFGAFGKKALVSAATTVTGGFLNGFGSATSAGADKFLAGGLRGLVKTSSSLGRAAVNSGFAAATATVNKVMSRGIHVAVDGGSWEDFAEDFDSVSDWAGVAAATVQAGVGSLAGDFFTTDGTNWGLEENIFNTGALRGAASLTGNLSGALTEYAMSGRTSLNLLNMSMFNLEDAKGGRLSGGLLQLNLGGGGNLFNIGQGGWSTSIDTIAAAMGGLDEIRRVSRAKIAGEGSHALGVLNMVNYQATGGDYRLARDIWNRNIKVAFEDLGRTAYGLYRHRKTPDTIVVNQRYNTNDREDAAVLASAGSHEGQHLYDRRDLGYTTEAEAHTRGRQTYMNLLEILELKGNRRLMDTIDAALADPRSWMANRGDVDYWKLAQDADGNWGWREDGSLDFDVNALPPDKQKIIKEALKQNDIELTEDGRVRHQDMNKMMIKALGNALYEKHIAASLSGAYPRTSLSGVQPLRTQNYNAFRNIWNLRGKFMKGTEQFAKVSGIAEKMMSPKGDPTNDQIKALDKALFGAYNSGFLIQNSVSINTKGLVNVGSSEDPLYVPVRLRPGDNDHKVTSYPGWRILWSRPDLGIRRHPGIDIGSVGDSDVVTAADKSSAYLRWTQTYGLSARTPYTREGQEFENALGHLEVNKTIMDYLNAFGTKGVKAAEKGLTNIPAGMVIGQVGNTGNSLGAHLDWRIFPGNNLKKSVNPLENNFYKQYLSSTRATYTARMLSNLQGKTSGEAWRNPQTQLQIMGFRLYPTDIAKPYIDTKWYLELMRAMENK